MLLTTLITAQIIDQTCTYKRLQNLNTLKKLIFQCQNSIESFSKRFSSRIIELQEQILLVKLLDNFKLKKYAQVLSALFIILVRVIEKVRSFFWLVVRRKFKSWLDSIYVVYLMLLHDGSVLQMNENLLIKIVLDMYPGFKIRT